MTHLIFFLGTTWYPTRKLKEAVLVNVVPNSTFTWTTSSWLNISKEAQHVRHASLTFHTVLANKDTFVEIVIVPLINPAILKSLNIAKILHYIKWNCKYLNLHAKHFFLAILFLASLRTYFPILDWLMRQVDVVPAFTFRGYIVFTMMYDNINISIFLLLYVYSYSICLKTTVLYYFESKCKYLWQV